MEIPKFTITKPREHWSNGYFVTYFQFAGVEFKLMQADGKRNELDTNLYVEDRAPNKIHEPEHRWIKGRYFQKFDGLMSVECAVQILQLFRMFYATGVGDGKEDAKKDFRKAIGL
jgi:hypothetical protein